MLSKCIGIFFAIITVGAGKQFSYNESLFYAEIAGDIADYFNCGCIYILNAFHKKDQIFKETMVKRIVLKFKKTTNVHTFEEYRHVQEEDNAMICNIPLNILIACDDECHLNFAKHSYSTNMQGVDSVGGSVWLVFLESINDIYIQEYFKEIFTPFDTQLIVISLDPKPKMELKEVYRVRHDRPIRSPSFGWWHEDTGLDLMPKSVIYDRRIGLEGIRFKTAYIENKPMTYSMEQTMDGKQALVGFIGDIWTALEESLNFSSDLTQNDVYGSLSEDNTWSGLIHDLQNEKYEVGVCDMAYTYNRFQVVGFSSPLLITKMQIYYQSTGTALQKNAIFTPLGLDTWITLLFWLTMSPMLITVSFRFCDYYFGTEENLTVDQAFFFVMGALCGIVKTPKLFACRLLFLSTFIITTIVIPAYSASLMSSLTILSPHIPFRDMKEFYEHGKMRMIVKYSTFEYDLFKYDTAPDQSLKRIYQRDMAKLPAPEFPRNNPEAIEKICKDKGLAFFALSDAFTYSLNYEQKRKGRNHACNVARMPRDAGMISLGMVFPKKSHFRGVINNKLSLLPALGILQRLKRKYLPPASPPSQDDHISIGLNNIFMMFVILGVGIATSLIILAIERQTYRRKKLLGYNLSTRRERFAYYN